jgi:hypothetical protein
VELIQSLLFLAFAALLLLLRFDANRFGTAEYDDEDRNVGWRGWVRRLAYFSLAIALVLLIYTLYPRPISDLHLDLGPDRGQALLLGLAYGAGGTLVAFFAAWLRYGRLRLPQARHYPRAVVNSVATAFIDEALFRGVILGVFLLWGWPPALAIAAETIVYALATRLGAPGRSLLQLLVVVGIGVVGGVLVVLTAGIGAAVLGHAITRFSFFVATGHTGHVRPAGSEPEELAGWALPPRGWEPVGGTASTGLQIQRPGTTQPQPTAQLGPGMRPYDPYAPTQVTLPPAQRPQLPYAGQSPYQWGSNGANPNGTAGPIGPQLAQYPPRTPANPRNGGPETTRPEETTPR